MDILKWYLKVVRDNFSNFKGRAGRPEYWYFVLFNVIVNVILGYVLRLASPTVSYIVSSIYGLAVLVPSLAVTVRRLHDLGKGGGWIFVSLIPLVGSIWLIILLASRGEATENRFGNIPSDNPEECGCCTRKEE